MAEIAKCPKCGKPIDEAHENSWCIECGEPLPREIRDLLPRQVVLAAAATASQAAVAETRSSSPVVNRYQDAYRVGSAMVGLGNSIKVACGILGIIVSVGSVEQLGSLALAGMFFGLVAGGLFWICGVMVAAHGQVLRATLDTAVASSRFMTDPERAEAMSLPASVVNRSATEPGA